MGTGMGNRAFDTRHAPRAICDAPADFPPSRKHPHKHAEPLDCGEPSPLSLSKWLTSLFPKKIRSKTMTKVPDPFKTTDHDKRENIMPARLSQMLIRYFKSCPHLSSTCPVSRSEKVK